MFDLVTSIGRPDPKLDWWKGSAMIEGCVVFECSGNRTDVIEVMSRFVDRRTNEVQHRDKRSAQRASEGKF